MIKSSFFSFRVSSIKVLPFPVPKGFHLVSFFCNSVRLVFLSPIRTPIAFVNSFTYSSSCLLFSYLFAGELMSISGVSSFIESCSTSSVTGSFFFSSGMENAGVFTSIESCSTSSFGTSFSSSFTSSFGTSFISSSETSSTLIVGFLLSVPGKANGVETSLWGG